MSSRFYQSLYICNVQKKRQIKKYREYKNRKVIKKIRKIASPKNLHYNELDAQDEACHRQAFAL
jgi:hypothetical protein